MWEHLGYTSISMGEGPSDLAATSTGAVSTATTAGATTGVARAVTSGSVAFTSTLRVALELAAAGAAAVTLAAPGVAAAAGTTVGAMVFFLRLTMGTMGGSGGRAACAKDQLELVSNSVGYTDRETHNNERNAKGANE